MIGALPAVGDRGRLWRLGRLGACPTTNLKVPDPKATDHPSTPGLRNDQRRNMWVHSAGNRAAGVAGSPRLPAPAGVQPLPAYLPTIPATQLEIAGRFHPWCSAWSCRTLSRLHLWTLRGRVHARRH